MLENETSLDQNIATQSTPRREIDWVLSSNAALDSSRAAAAPFTQRRRSSPRVESISVAATDVNRATGINGVFLPPSNAVGNPYIPLSSPSTVAAVHTPVAKPASSLPHVKHELVVVQAGEISRGPAASLIERFV